MLEEFIKWSNANEGFVAILLFALALFLGWVSGIFQALRRRPRFTIEAIEGPTLCTTFETGREYNGYPTHRTAISLYLSITNTGNAPSSIKEVAVGYRRHLTKFNWPRFKDIGTWFRHTVKWFRDAITWYWLDKPTGVLSDFQVQIGENVKVYPLLLQITQSTNTATNRYLQIGENVNGIVYFEQDESWGIFFPRSKNGLTKIKVRIKDAFGKTHSQVFEVPVVSLSEAKRFCPNFGESIETSITTERKIRRELQT